MEVKLREYKIRNLAHLMRLREELPAKYGPEAKEAVDKLIIKTSALRLYNMVDYFTTLLKLSDKYPELKVLLPSEEEVDIMLKEGDRGD